jgi:hypothetical protein
MRKLIVSNFLTLDGYYESADKTFDRFTFILARPPSMAGRGRWSVA